MTDIQEISVKSGIRPSECSCEKCKNLCRTPCLGTPEDINKLLEAGYGKRLTPVLWGVGMLVGLTINPLRWFNLVWKIMDGVRFVNQTDCVSFTIKD